MHLCSQGDARKRAIAQLAVAKLEANQTMMGNKMDPLQAAAKTYIVREHGVRRQA